MDMNLGKLRETARDREVWLQSTGSQRVGHGWANEWQQQQFSPIFEGLFPHLLLRDVFPDHLLKIPSSFSSQYSLLPSLFFLLVAWQGKGQRREHGRNDNACVLLFEKLCNTSWRPNIWLPATSWPISSHQHHPSHTHFLAGSPCQAQGCLRALAPAHSFDRTHFPCTSAKFTAWLQQGLSSDACSLEGLVFPNCPFLK